MTATRRAAPAAGARWLWTADLCDRLGIHPVTVWRWIKNGTLPAPFYVGLRRAWMLSDIEAWEAKQMAHAAPTTRPGEDDHDAIR